MKYDVCIVGAGIAGSSLAYELASGFDVCLIEEKGLDDVGKKPCPGAVEGSWFKRFSPDDFNASVLRISSMRLSFGGRSLRVKFIGHVIDRHRFCEGLLEAAFAEGCEWLRGRAEPRFEVGIDTVAADGTRISADVYVDASGSSAVLRRHYLQNNPEMFSLGCMETVEGGDMGDELDVHLLNARETGWVFPAEHSTNVGYVGAGACGSGFEEKLNSFKEEIGLGEARIIERGYGLIPSYRPIKLVYHNMVAIGDAGFTINPITCGGIGPSIYASNMLAGSIRRGDGLDAFESEYWRFLGKKYSRLYYISRAIRTGWFPLWLGAKAYYSNDSHLGKLIRNLL
jgi:flavin-dependent dehydrogenase